MLNPVEELIFWTGIMRDHCDFILMTVQYNEYDTIEYTKLFKKTFLLLHEKAKSISNTMDFSNLNSLIDSIRNTVTNFISFEEILLGSVLGCKLNTNMSATFFNLMISEAKETLKTLNDIQMGGVPENPAKEILDLNITWLRDSSGHSAILSKNLDSGLERVNIDELKEFEKTFNTLLLGMQDLKMMFMRSGVEVGLLEIQTQKFKENLKVFILFLEKIRSLSLKCNIAGFVRPILPDHMIREANHYLATVNYYESLL